MDKVSKEGSKVQGPKSGIKEDDESPVFDLGLWTLDFGPAPLGTSK
jgi:hypothetical protein